MQSVYAFYQVSNPDITVQEKFLNYSVEQMGDLYLVMLQLLLAIRNRSENFLEQSQKKFLATESERNPSRNFVDNRVFRLILENEAFNQAIENKRLNYWDMDSEYANLLFNELREKSWYEEYLNKKETTLKDDQKLLIRLYKEIVAPNDKLYDYLEDKRLTWIDDFPLVNTALVKMLGRINASNVSRSLVPRLYKNEEDRDYMLDLFRKVVLHDEKLTAEIIGKTPNWDQDRIADLDMIILKMGIAEFIYFPSIPVRVTINEYLEISKEYSTSKSSIFINGILDNLVREYSETGRLNKIGRGLL